MLLFNSLLSSPAILSNAKVLPSSICSSDNKETISEKVITFVLKGSIFSNKSSIFLFTVSELYKLNCLINKINSSSFNIPSLSSSIS